LYEQKVTCAVCETAFPTLKVRSRFSHAFQTDSDFCPHYKDENNPILYLINVCPNCGFSFSKQFSNFFPPGSMEEIRERVSKKWDKREFSSSRTPQQAIDTYKLALVSGELKKEKNSVIAGICLRLSWLYRMTKDHNQEIRFMALAAQQYEKAYQLSDFEDTSMSEMKVLYLLGELYRRLEEHSRAIKFFSLVIEHKNKNLETGIVKMAREQWLETKEAYNAKVNM
jgi:uncharacterized protein (DUF2225 family)